MYLNQRPDLLERMAEQGQVLVPTLSCFYGVAGLDDDGGHPPDTWSPLLVELAQYNLEQADRTLTAARGAASGSRSATTGTRSTTARIELERMVHHGMPAMDALVAATATGAAALGLGDELGTIEPRQDRGPAWSSTATRSPTRGCCGGASGSGS